jgi:hypothetical protein
VAVGPVVTIVIVMTGSGVSIHGTVGHRIVGRERELTQLDELVVGVRASRRVARCTTIALRRSRCKLPPGAMLADEVR